jgi:hypothetical protein
MLAKEVVVGMARSQLNMHRLRFTLCWTAVVVCFPVILLALVCVTLLHPITSLKSRFHPSLHLWMSVMDWVNGIPIGYSYWVQYHAPSMLDEIEVHHDE